MPWFPANALGYSIRRWTVEQGLPDTRVTALAQTPDGYLWCGTYNGVVRFDGVQFHYFRSDRYPKLKSFEAAQMLCDSRGCLWLRGRFGKLLSYEDGKFREWDTLTTFGMKHCGWLTQASDGSIWIAALNRSRYVRLHDGQIKTFDVPGTSFSQNDSFCVQTDSVLWGRTPKDNSIVRITSRGFAAYSCVSPDGDPEVVGRYFDLRDGTHALTTLDGIYVLKNSGWKLLYPLPFRIHPGIALDGLEDRDGNIWMGTWKAGLILRKPDGRIGRVRLPGEGDVPFTTAMVQDKDGNVWIGTSDGLYRISKEAFRTWTEADGITGPQLFSIRQDASRRLWFVAWGGISWRGTDDSAFTTLSWLGDPRLESLRTPQIPGTLVHVRPSAAFASSNSVWIGRRDGGLGEISTNGSRFIGFVSSRVFAILKSSSSGLWIGTQEGLYRRANGDFHAAALPAEAASKRVPALAEDSKGRVYAGVEDVGLMRRDHGRWRRLTKPTDLGSDGISGIFIDEQGTVWLATRFAGLARWKNLHWTNYAGPESDPWDLHGVTTDGSGGLWVTSTRGVIFLTRKAFEDYAEGRTPAIHYLRLGRDDGLASASCSGLEDGICRSADDRIWVATDEGTSVIDPVQWNRWRRHRPPEDVRIVKLFVDDVPIPAGSTDEVVIPPGSRRVEIHYAATDLSSLEAVRFRYRLDGFDSAWVDSGAQRFVAYHELPPGRFRFRVSAANRYDVWNPAGASVVLVVRPQWWQTVWFRVAVGILAFAVLWFTRSVKLRQLQRERTRREEFARQLIQSQEAERKRIAGELHDSMGQDLILIKNSASLTLRKCAPTPTIHERLQEMAELASHALSNARAITSNLRPPELDRLGLTAALEAMVDKSAENSGIHFVASIENVNGLWPPEQEINVYRVVQESVNNALKHADPKRIRLEVRRRPKDVAILIEDDGRGFIPEELVTSGKSPGMGLTGLRERVRILGGIMELKSDRKAGTSLHYWIPVPDHGQK